MKYMLSFPGFSSKHREGQRGEGEREREHQVHVLSFSYWTAKIFLLWVFLSWAFPRSKYLDHEKL